MGVAMDSQKRRKRWAEDASHRLHRRQPRTRDDGQQQYHASEAEPAAPDEIADNRRAAAQPSIIQSPQDRRNQHVEIFIVPWAYAVCLRAKSIRNSRTFSDSVDLLTAHAECQPHYDDAQDELRDGDEIELPEDPREHYRAALSEWGRARHLRKICRLTGTYPMDTGDMTTGEVYSWFIELHAMVNRYRAAIGE